MDLSSPQGPGAAPGGVRTQEPELLLDMFTPQGSELHLDVSTIQRLVLHMDVPGQ